MQILADDGGIEPQPREGSIRFRGGLSPRLNHHPFVEGRWGIRSSIQLSETSHPPFTFLTFGVLVDRVGIEPTTFAL